MITWFLQILRYEQWSKPCVKGLILEGVPLVEQSVVEHQFDTDPRLRKHITEATTAD